MTSDPSLWAAVALGGAGGSILRALIFRALRHIPKPIGGSARATLAVNGLGCFLLGLSSPSVATAPSWLQVFWMTGLCGGLTTFSTFCADILERPPRHTHAQRVGLILGHALLGLAALALGSQLANTSFGE